MLYIFLNKEQHIVDIHIIKYFVRTHVQQESRVQASLSWSASFRTGESSAQRTLRFPVSQ